MIHEVINLEIDYEKLGREKGEFQPTLHAFIPNDCPEMLAYTPDRPTILVIPGGGYGYVSDREAEPIALYYLTRGFNCFILYYSVAPARYPVSLLEAGKAMQVIHENAEKYHVNLDRIFLCGFSAGAHLTASLGLLRNQPTILDILGTTEEVFKPAGMILSYPVIAKSSHLGSFANLLGEDHTEEEAERLNLLHYVDEQTPPCFLWHTFEDTVVPLENTMLFAQKLRQHNVPFELHVYEHRGHGMALGTKITCKIPNRLGNWIEMSADWITERFA